MPNYINFAIKNKATCKVVNDIIANPSISNAGRLVN